MKRTFTLFFTAIFALVNGSLVYGQTANTAGATTNPETVTATTATVPEIQVIAPTAPVAPPQATQIQRVTTAPAAPSAPFDLSGSLTILPLAYDNTDTASRDVEDFYFGINPGLDLSTQFKILNNRIMTVGLHYDLRFRYYLTEENEVHGADAKDYKHNFEATADLPLTDKVSLGMYTEWEYFAISTDQSREDLWVEANPSLTYSFNKFTNMTLAYDFIYNAEVSGNVDPNDIDNGRGAPTDGDDLGTELAAPGTDFVFFDPSATLPATSGNEPYVVGQRLMLGVNHKFSDQTKGGLKYWFGRWTSNQDAAEHFENSFRADLGQALWKGAGARLRYELRIRDFIYQLIPDGSAGLREFRNRFQLEVDQAITKNLSVGFHTRHQFTNANNPAKEFTYNRFWTGVTVTF